MFYNQINSLHLHFKLKKRTQFDKISYTLKLLFIIRLDNKFIVKPIFYNNTRIYNKNTKYFKMYIR